MENLVWIDCEMTGLDLTRDALIEVAVLVTDSQLNVLGDGVDLIIKPPAEALEAMGEFVRNMHTSSGLITQIESGISMAEAEAQIMEYVRQFVPTAKAAPLCGNTISTDRAFLHRDMPALEGYLHYRNIDVSSVKELVRRWYPHAFFAAPEKTGNHRALGDIKDSVKELRYYREAVFVPDVGPSRIDARQIAARYTGEFLMTNPYSVAD